MKTNERLYGELQPRPIPEEYKRERIIKLKQHLVALAFDVPMDNVRIREVEDAVKFWQGLI